MHDVLVDVLEPIRKVMEGGINLLCPDGKRGLCFPVLAAYIADYQEQHVLASIRQGIVLNVLYQHIKENSYERGRRTTTTAAAMMTTTMTTTVTVMMMTTLAASPPPNPFVLLLMLGP